MVFLFHAAVKDSRMKWLDHIFAVRQRALRFTASPAKPWNRIGDLLRKGSRDVENSRCESICTVGSKQYLSRLCSSYFSHRRFAEDASFWSSVTISLRWSENPILYCILQSTILLPRYGKYENVVWCWFHDGCDAAMRQQ